MVEYEKVVLPTITYNMESTTNMTNKDMEEMEKIQGKMLRKIYNVPPSTWKAIIKEKSEEGTMKTLRFLRDHMQMEVNM